jgi:hypothetical protein
MGRQAQDQPAAFLENFLGGSGGGTAGPGKCLATVGCEVEAQHGEAAGEETRGKRTAE